MRISDWSSDVCSSDLVEPIYGGGRREVRKGEEGFRITTLATEAGCRPDTGNRYVPRRGAVHMNHFGHCLGVLQISENDLVAHHGSSAQRLLSLWHAFHRRRVGTLGITCHEPQLRGTLVGEDVELVRDILSQEHTFVLQSL